MFSQFDARGGAPKASPRRPAKRRQVARACHSCRLNRIKCDADVPCRKCFAKGTKCSNARTAAGRAYPAGSTGTLDTHAHDRNLPLQHVRTRAVTPLDSTSSQESSAALFSAFNDARSQYRFLKSTHHAARPHFTLSSAHFVYRLQAELQRGREDAQDKSPDSVNSVSRSHSDLFTLISHNTSPDPVDQLRRPNPRPFCVDSIGDLRNNMSRQQEECYLNLYWQSHHLQLPLLDQATFVKEYSELWIPTTGRRAPSALVEIMLALCVQSSATSAPSVQREAGEDNDSAGELWFLRFERLLSKEEEAPSLLTAQAAAMATIYLLNISRAKAAHAALAAALSIASTSALEARHPTPEPELSRRQSIFQCLYLLDTNLGLDRGGNFLLESPGPEYTLSTGPSRLSQQTEYSDPEIDDYYEFSTELAMVSRFICDALLCAKSDSGGTNKSTGTNGWEDESTILQKGMQDIQIWIRRVPETLLLQRKGAGKPFSTQRLQLDLDSYAPFWLQRQRILLELEFHCQMMLLYRDFVFAQNPQVLHTMLSAGHGVSCMLHASTITSIIAQVIAESDILNLMHGIYNFQRDAYLILAAFSVSHPLCPHAPTALASMQTATATFQTLAEKHGLGVSNDAPKAASRLLDEVRTISSSLRRTTATLGSTSQSTSSHATSRSGSVGLVPPQASEDYQMSASGTFSATSEKQHSTVLSTLSDAPPPASTEADPRLFPSDGSMSNDFGMLQDQVALMLGDTSASQAMWNSTLFGAAWLDLATEQTASYEGTSTDSLG